MELFETDPKFSKREMAIEHTLESDNANNPSLAGIDCQVLIAKH